MPTSSIPASGGGGLRPKYVKFTTSGTFTLPDGYGAANPLLIDIQVIGGGGAGNATVATNPSSFQITSVGASRINYFGDGSIFQNPLATAVTIPGVDVSNTQNGQGGGSGGIAKTQMYLTSNLTITVGAAGARATATSPASNSTANTGFSFRRDDFTTNSTTTTQGATVTRNLAMTSGGSGGMSTAGAVSATGGNAANSGNFAVTYGFNSQLNNSFTANQNNAVSSAINTGSAGTAGSPAGSAGDAIPLLGALAGGSGTTTPVYGAFGISGKRGDTTTHSGVEGTGGGAGSIGASGAVVITYWA